MYNDDDHDDEYHDHRDDNHPPGNLFSASRGCIPCAPPSASNDFWVTMRMVTAQPQLFYLICKGPAEAGTCARPHALVRMLHATLNVESLDKPSKYQGFAGMHVGLTSCLSCMNS
jgi:hypothetical protein